MSENYWTRRRLGRRAVLRGGVTGLFGLAGAALVGCGSDDPAAPASSTGTPSAGATSAATQAPAVAPVDFKRGGIARMGTPALSTGLDPHFSGAGYHKTRLAFDTLLDFDEDGLPAVRDDSLASGYEIVDETTVLVSLKEGVTFHDGTPFNAEAVAWNVSRQLQPDPPGATPHAGEILHTERIEAVDEHTARWILSQPDSGIITAFTNHSTQMLSPTHYEGKSLDEVMWRPVGTGRYMFKEYSADAFVKYQSNPDYFHKLPDGGSAGILDEIHELAIPDAVARGTALLNGDVEILDESPATMLDLLEADPNIEGAKAEGFAVRNLYIDHALPPLDNVDIRRALMWSWDPDGYNAIIDNGIGKPATSGLSSIFTWAHVDIPDYPTFDMERAREYVERSGVPESERRLLIGGNTVAFQFVQAAWEQLGFTLEHVADTAGRINRNAGVTNPDVHGVIGSRITSRPDPGWQANVIWRSDATYNYGWGDTGPMDELTDRGMATYDIEERAEIYREIQEVYADQLYSMFNKVEIPFWVHARTPLTGFRHYATGRGDYRYLHFTA